MTLWEVPTEARTAPPWSSNSIELKCNIWYKYNTKYTWHLACPTSEKKCFNFRLDLLLLIYSHTKYNIKQITVVTSVNEWYNFHYSKLQYRNTYEFATIILHRQYKRFTMLRLAFPHVFFHRQQTVSVPSNILWRNFTTELSISSPSILCILYPFFRQPVGSCMHVWEST